MRVFAAFMALWGIASATSHVSKRSNRDYTKFDYYTVHLDPSTSPHDFSRHLGLEYDGLYDVLDDHHIFRKEKHDNDIVRESIQELKRRRKVKRDLEPHILDSVRFDQKQVLKKRLVKRGILPAEVRQRQTAEQKAVAERLAVAKQLSIADPIFKEQWHLFNSDQVGNDMNVTGVWQQGITGKGATVCIIDDGLDMDSKDLKQNYFASGSYDFNDGADEPKPRLSDDQHGTRCAGEVAAVKNDVCGVGVAYNSRISGVRILSAPIPDMDEAAAVIYGFQENDIYSCSWGPPDDGKTMEAPGVLIKKAFLKAIQEGRNGKGAIYVFAAGNGALSQDNCNFDGYTNSIYSVTIGAIDKTNSHPYYSEKCSAQMAVTYSSGAGDAIHTTDVGVDKCTNQHGGTSAAGPLVAGVYALVLEARPDFTWRDIQWVTALTSVPIYKEEPESSWQTTAIGRKFSHQYGYGKVDAWAMVELAKTWKLVKKQAWYFSPWIHVRHDIPQGNQGLSSEFEVTKDMLKKANLERIEHVTVTMNVEHMRRGDLSVELHSPHGIISHLSETRRGDEAPKGYEDWTFMTVAHFGEKGIGKWTIVVKDDQENTFTGKFIDWRLKLWGESINPAKQGNLPMPTEHDDDDHDVDVVSGVVGTTSLGPQPAKPTGTQTGLPVRPSIAKPTGASSPNPTVAPGTPAGKPGQTAPTATGTPSFSADDSFLPSPFPTFGVSKRTQVWIYGSVALILIFCCSLALYFYLQRRKRLRNNPRDNYEFAVLDDLEETDGMLSSNKKDRRRRAGELYDAFAGESEDDLFSDADDDAAYRDARVNDDDEDEEYSGGGSSRFNEKLRQDDEDEEDEKAGLVR